MEFTGASKFAGAEKLTGASSSLPAAGRNKDLPWECSSSDDMGEDGAGRAGAGKLVTKAEEQRESPPSEDDFVDEPDEAATAASTAIRYLLPSYSDVHFRPTSDVHFGRYVHLHIPPEVFRGIVAFL